jgi:glutamyl-tRNA synthetase
MTVKTRFAPSPTGRLHVGNARVALINWLFAKQAGGHFLLRMDDTDTDRSEERFALGIEEDLRWLGLAWDSQVAQSSRFERYAAVFEQLKTAGRLYPCYETPEELDLKRKVQLSQGKPPLYDRAALKASPEQRQTWEAAGIIPHWRFQLNDGLVAWEDLGRGALQFDRRHLSDPVLFRAGQAPVYTLASVVDDVDLAITHVIRGEDHISNTAVQIQLCEAIGGTPPRYAHLSLLTDAKGEGLSKRLGSLSLATLREEGIEAMAVNSLLARLGSSQPVEAKASLEAVLEGFELGHYSRGTPKFDQDELTLLNGRVLHLLPFATVAPRLAALGLEKVTEEFWQAVRPNLNTLADAALWWRLCYEALPPREQDTAFLADAAAHLPDGTLTVDTWGIWVERLKQATGRKGKALFQPLRLALTGQEHGPELAGLLPLLGRARVLERLQG